MNNCWKTSVTELLAIFRGALLAVIPWVEKAKIKWKDGEAYDDWDNIVESLYENIVCSSLTSDVILKYGIAKYNFNYDSYDSINFIEVKINNNPEKKYAFVAFQSNSSLLDKVKVAELNKAEKVVGYVDLSLAELEFVFVKNINGKKEIVDSVEVEL